jgi:hypothetical protein
MRTINSRSSVPEVYLCWSEGKQSPSNRIQHSVGMSSAASPASLAEQVVLVTAGC